MLSKTPVLFTQTIGLRTVQKHETVRTTKRNEQTSIRDVFCLMTYKTSPHALKTGQTVVFLKWETGRSWYQVIPQEGNVGGMLLGCTVGFSKPNLITSSISESNQQYWGITDCVSLLGPLKALGSICFTVYIRTQQNSTSSRMCKLTMNRT